jgi:hypothetical protein
VEGESPLIIGLAVLAASRVLVGPAATKITGLKGKWSGIPAICRMFLMRERMKYRSAVICQPPILLGSNMEGMAIQSAEMNVVLFQLILLL